MVTKGAPDPARLVPTWHQRPKEPPLRGPSAATRTVWRTILRRPWAPLEELAEVAGLKIAQIERLTLAWEACGSLRRQRQYDKRTGRWAVCVCATGGG